MSFSFNNLIPLIILSKHPGKFLKLSCTSLQEPSKLIIHSSKPTFNNLSTYKGNKYPLVIIDALTPISLAYLINSIIFLCSNGSPPVNLIIL